MILDADESFKVEGQETVQPRNNDFVTFRRFTEESSAKELMQVLQENGLDYVWTQERDSLDGLYGDKVFKKEILVKINRHDFATADKILLEESSEALNDVGSDHYLFSFTNEELVDLISKADEWSEFDFLLAQRILKQRGVELQTGDVQKLKHDRMVELTKPQSNEKLWIYIGYLSALAGGLFGIFIGWHLSTFKKLLPNGQQVFAYDVKDRTHGNRILVISVVVFLAILMLRLAGTKFI